MNNHIHSIFVSYRYSDTAGHAGRLYDRLCHWYDRDQIFYDKSSVEFGDKFPEELERALDSAKAVIVIVGPDWVSIINEHAKDEYVDYVREEVRISLERRACSHVTVLPILVEGASIPKEQDFDSDLRSDIRELLHIQFLSFSDDIKGWEFRFGQLLEKLSKVDAIPQPFAHLVNSDRYPTLKFDDAKSPKRTASLDMVEIERRFSTVSMSLLNWPQETEGEWIVRSELDELRESCLNEGSSATVLLGGPGEGKSALLSRLGNSLSCEDLVLLAVKADQVPRNTASLKDFDDWIGGPCPVSELLIDISQEKSVVVLIDQLDALSELVDQHSERLAVLIQFVHLLSGTPNLHVLLSCREFEFRHDVRFNSIEAEEVSLSRLNWDQVNPLLLDKGFETAGWGSEVKNVLQTPQHLSMFLKHSAKSNTVPPFTNYQGLLSRIVEQRIEKVHGPKTVEAAETLAITMAQEEVLWVNIHRFDENYWNEIQSLESGDFLIRSEDHQRIGFRHQSLFDYFRARAFLRNQRSLVSFITEEKQESLFVRPLLWSTLNYLHATDKALYHKQVGELWNHQALRTHIRYLLIDFLGQLASPDLEETRWLLSEFDQSNDQARILSAVSGSPGWFKRLKSRIPSLMVREANEAAEVLPLLVGALDFDSDHVIELLGIHWIHKQKYLRNTIFVLRELKEWESKSLGLALQVADWGDSDTFSICDLASRISISVPTNAPKVIVRYLNARLTRLIESQTSVPPSKELNQNLDDSIESLVVSSAQYRNLIDSDTEWHGISKLALRAPEEFLAGIWDWLTKVFNYLSPPSSLKVRKYRGSLNSPFDRDDRRKSPLIEAVKQSASNFAESEPDEFINFVHRKKNTDVLEMQRILAIGLQSIVQQQPDQVLNYLLEDTRRFILGGMQDPQSDTKGLIANLVPCLDDSQIRNLEQTILNWQVNQQAPIEFDDSRSRMERQKLARRFRLQLLRSFPFSKLSHSTQIFITQEIRALTPRKSEGIEISEAKIIDSPMSAIQMARAKDQEILNLFHDLTDSTEWNHPKRGFTELVGGSIQASREFAQFAKENVPRALRIIRSFEAGKSERPAGAAIVELANELDYADDVIQVIHELDSKGFSSEEFRIDVARCLGSLARELDGLSDDACSMLESWLTSHDDKSGISAHIDDSAMEPIYPNQESSAEAQIASLLWDGSIAHLLPEGNYPVLEALTHGYLRRKPQAINLWGAMLEKHLLRQEDPRVWIEVSRYLNRPVFDDQERAIAFLDKLILSVPEILYSHSGVRLIFAILSWFPQEKINLIVERWILSDWSYGPQAAGEIMAVQYCRNPNDPTISRRFTAAIEGLGSTPTISEKIRLGITYTLTKAWVEPGFRFLTTPHLVALSTLESKEIEDALADIYRRVDVLPPDGHTKELLLAMLNRPRMLVQGSFFLLSSLKALLRDGFNPNLVYRIVNAIIEYRDFKTSDIRSPWSDSASDICDIALTLHRISETRARGLELFEQLLQARAWGVEERLRSIDRPQFHRSD